MFSNPRSDRVKAVARLARRSAREKSGLFLIEGPLPVAEAMRHARADIVDVYVDTANTAAAHLGEQARAAGLPVVEVTSAVMTALCDAETPQGVLAVARMRCASLSDHLSHPARVGVVLGQVQDPGNVGTIIRGASAFGACPVVVSTGCADPWSPKVVRSSAGALFHGPVVAGVDLSSAVESLRGAGVRTLALAGSGSVDIRQVDVSAPHCWVLGNEAAGLPAQVLDQADERVHIPMAEPVESLNVAMAATVALWHSASHSP